MGDLPHIYQNSLKIYDSIDVIFKNVVLIYFYFTLFIGREINQNGTEHGDDYECCYFLPRR